MNGERGNWRGHVFEREASRLAKCLGYKEEYSGKWGIDLIASPPAGPPASRFVRPLFSPDGRSAFEFTCESDIGTGVVDELAEKVQKISKQGVALSGGVLGCDIRIADKTIEYAEERSVFVWDVRDFSFLTQKVHELTVCKRFVNERQVDAHVSLLSDLPVMRGSFARVQVAILFHHPLGDISRADFRKAMEKVNASVTNILGAVGFLPAKVETEIRCRGFYSKDLAEAQEVLDEFYDEEKVVYTFAGLNCYYQAPWSGLVLQP